MRLPASTKSRKRSTSCSNELADKAKRHIQSSSPTTCRKVESQLEDVFLVIFILNMDRRHNLVELFILGPPMARMAHSWMARQRMARSLTTSTTPESRTDQHKEPCAETSERGLNCCLVILRISQFRVQTVATAMNATVCAQTTLHRMRA